MSEGTEDFELTVSSDSEESVIENGTAEVAAAVEAAAVIATAVEAAAAVMATIDEAPLPQDDEKEEGGGNVSSAKPKRSRSTEDLRDLLQKRIKLEDEIHEIRDSVYHVQMSDDRTKWIELFILEASEYIQCMYGDKQIESSIIRPSDNRFVLQLDYHLIYKSADLVRLLEKEFPELRGSVKITMTRKADRKSVISFSEVEENERHLLLKRAIAITDEN